MPLLNFITWPLRKFNATALPDLKSFAGPGLGQTLHHIKEFMVLTTIVLPLTVSGMARKL